MSVVTIDLPTLEERSEDIPLLVEHFLQRFNQRNQRHVGINEGAVHLLTFDEQLHHPPPMKAIGGGKRKRGFLDSN